MTWTLVGIAVIAFVLMCRDQLRGSTMFFILCLVGIGLFAIKGNFGILLTVASDFMLMVHNLEKERSRVG